MVKDPMTLVHEENGYRFYVGREYGRGGFRYSIYNIVHAKISYGIPYYTTPKSGWRNRRYIEKVMGIKFPDKYQPTLHGMSETYLSEDNNE